MVDEITESAAGENKRAEVSLSITTNSEGHLGIFIFFIKLKLSYLVKLKTEIEFSNWGEKRTR